jgi:hypothetical protein
LYVHSLMWPFNNNLFVLHLDHWPTDKLHNRLGVSDFLFEKREDQIAQLYSRLYASGIWRSCWKLSMHRLEL